ncbi:hypothetical protein [Mesorhizobium captivum]|uniref:hypothetical protein n=1 Tax=Mesorhizobium captivum TaxID=3072319 RepID=UPI002A23DB95|nr:hypothetical protein [Mesorhizobium sp. VK3C]MDX8450470.1 hypothetical protein [Mesorhizobium sp. VK3C]
MAAFVALIALGARVENDFRAEHPEPWPISYKRLIDWRVAAAIVIYVTINSTIYYVYFIPGLCDGYIVYPAATMVLANLIYGSGIVIGLRGWPLPAAVFVALSIIVRSYIFGHASMRHVQETNLSAGISETLAIVAGILSGSAVLVLAPPKAFCRRLTYMLVGVAVMVGLSENFCL